MNSERTVAFSALVNSAEKMTPLLPWSKDFEKDKFLWPNFTSLEVRTSQNKRSMLIANIEQFRFSLMQVRNFILVFP